MVYLWHFLLTDLHRCPQGLRYRWHRIRLLLFNFHQLWRAIFDQFGRIPNSRLLFIECTFHRHQGRRYSMAYVTHPHSLSFGSNQLTTLSYWVVFAFFNVLESALSVTYWLPFYYVFKFGLVMWLGLPQFRYDKQSFDSRSLN